MIRPLTRLETLKRPRLLPALPAAAAAVAVLAACSSSGTSSSRRQQQQSRRGDCGQPEDRRASGGVRVLTTRRGSRCTRSPPIRPPRRGATGRARRTGRRCRGPATAPGLQGPFGTIKRSDGSTQATFDGHPLYTFVGDTAPGQAKGNGLNAFGGLWHEVTTSGSAPAGSSSSGSGSGGYGY